MADNSAGISSFEKTHYPFTFAAPPSTEIIDSMKLLFCPVCGATADMQPFTDNVRESGICCNCGSWNRQRLMAVLLMHVIERVTGVRLTHVSSLEVPDTLQIFGAEWFGALHKTLRRLKGYRWSRYSGPTHKSGDVIDGCPHQDLLSTSFLDNQFDIVLTADVLEHIPEPYLAHREIYRILKPGGVHIFTVPSNMNNPLDDQRAALANGELIRLKPPEWHGKEVDSNLVYTVFGLEMICHLWSLGFFVRFYEISSPGKGIIGPRAVGFEATKHHEPLLREIPEGLRSQSSLQFNKAKIE
ncbi:MAG: class I SAM-dependent methyltransferase [Candidatus Sulfobium sp.]|jgi:SAM-dependent methyltransferase